MAKTALSRDEALRLLREHMPVLRERFGVTELTLFGSTARDEAAAESDVDVLVRFGRKPEISWGCYAAQSYLTDVFGREVDMVERHRMRKEYLPWVEAEAVDPMNPRPHMPNGSRPKRWDVYVQDMLKRCANIIESTNELGREEVEAEREKLESVHLSIILLGEAANKIPKRIQDAHPEINWSRTIGMRHRMVHGYEDTDDQIVWQTIQEDIPAMIPRLNALLREAQLELESQES